ncbi:MAG: DUF3095 domain-containing protein [Planctomycetes bacterium]|nr:DUF3095 domain-containing protein [Planctomycetota bacterium]
MSEDFYKNLKGFNGLIDIANPQRFESIPADWTLVLTDVKGSTKAIAQGKYKDVNTIGACCIIAASNACGDLSFPSIFGGDGASMAVPETHRERVARALIKTREMSVKEFGLDLRIAAVPMRVIRQAGLDVQVGKFLVSPQSSVAMFSGGGLAYAEKLMKERGSEFDVSAGLKAEGDFQGLECRWSPLQSRNGRMMACIVQVRAGNSDVHALYRGILKEVGELVDHRRPLSVKNLTLDWPPPFLMTELRVRIANPFKRWLEYGRLLLLSLGHSAFMRAKKHDASKGIGKYVNEVALNTDRIKFDDALRFVLDVDGKDEQTIRDLFARHFQAGEIFYGIHTSPTALLTCFVRSYTDDHFHFVDGGDGGYAMAAKQMKLQMSLVAQILEQEKLAKVLLERLADRDSPMSDTHTWQDDLDLCNARLKELRSQLK